MSSPKRFIQVGCGGWAGSWLEGVWPRLIKAGVVEPVAMVDIAPAALAHAQQRLGVSAERCFTDADKAFAENSDADFAVIVVPPVLHEQMVDLALKYDMDILSEKPMADTMAGCCRIYHKVSAAGRKMAVTMTHRFDQDKQSLEAAIKSGNYGPLNYVVHRFACNYRTFGSWGKFRHEIADPLLIEGTVHHFDILRALSGSDARAVYALTWNPPWGEYAGDSTGLITIEMTNGVRCFYEGAKANAATLNGWSNDYIRAECRDGTLELDRRQLRVLKGAVGAARPLAQDLPLLEQPAWCNAWLAEMFVGWLNGGPEPANCLRDNIQCCALLFAAIQSARTREPVDVQAFLNKHLGSQGMPIPLGTKCPGNVRSGPVATVPRSVHVPRCN